MKCLNCHSWVNDGELTCPYCRSPLQPFRDSEKDETVVIKRLEVSGNEARERYRISEEQTENFISATYKGEDLEFGIPVALRFFPAKNFLDLRATLKMKRDVRLAQHLQHDNIAQSYHIGEYNGERFLAFEFVDGYSLDDYLQSGTKFKPQEFLLIAQQVCRAIEYAHNKNIAHKDLHPQNIYIDKDGRVKVALFGFSRTVKDIAREGGFTVPEEYIVYESPEAVAGRDYSLPSDIYSLGAIFYRMLAGQPLYDAAGDVAAAVLNITPFPLRDVDKKIPPAFEQIVTRCLEKDPADRYANISLLLKDLEDPQILTGSLVERGTRQRSPEKTEKAAVAATDWVRVSLYVLIVILLILIAVLGYSLITMTDGSPI